MRPSETLCNSFHDSLSRRHFDPTNPANEDSYLRAQEIARIHGLTLDDIMNLSPKFWDMHIDPIICTDGAATTLLTIQYNLVAGTLGGFVSGREDIRTLVDDIINFRTIGQFCLTEIGHGLDVSNMETTATLLVDGGFELHTPHQGAAKFMPPTTPVLGRPCFAVVFAQLMVAGCPRGIRPFVVCLNDGFKMSPGISATVIPLRGSSAPVNHCLTTFHHVTLPSSALLGEIDVSVPPRLHFLLSIWRVAVGTLALSSVAIPGLHLASHIAYRYSIRRVVRGHDGSSVPIFSFRTQQIPIFTALAQALVLRAFHQEAIKLFADDELSPFIRHGIATAFKTVVVRDLLSSCSALSERCGAQGLFSFNQIIAHHDEMRGIAIAKGDIVVLCICLATELLLEKYSMPPSRDTHSLLALHEKGLMQKYKSIIVDSGHRSAKFASYGLPHCEDIVRAIVYRMAYDAAIAAQVPQSLIDLFVCHVVKRNLGWYVEHQLLSSEELEDLEDSSIERSLPHIAKWVAGLDVGSYVTAPMVSDTAWADFLSRLQKFEGKVTAKL
ncbi:acyl-CoA oxidase [Mycena maculata]|uniref:Acyl-CoA oxidase n=1 Tax=Mycena maculata TaxID=230809 RepID=A0AAD7ISM0_9AGAR|nr:acyl-CoA oxidase [Mycena maculata]